MNYLLDTCIVSEFTRRRPNGNVVQWVRATDEEKQFLSAITIGEVHRGLERLPESRRKDELITWANNDLIHRFGKRILPLDVDTMLMWASLVARLERSGHPIAMMDSLIAATASLHHLIVVTRNISDFLPCGVQVINPWEQQSFA